MSQKKQKVFDPDKVSMGRLFTWHSRTFSAGVVSILIGYLTFYCTDVLGMQAALVGSILMASKIFDGVTDLCAGWLVDNTNTRWGKARPYEFSILGMWLTCALLFSTPVAWGVMLQAVWLFVMYSLLFSVFGTLLNASETPYVIRAFGTRHAVVKVASYGGVIVTLGSMIVSIIFPQQVANAGVDPAAWRSMILMYAVPLAAVGMCRFIFIKEDRVQYIESNTEGEEAQKRDEKVTVKEMLHMLLKNKYVWLFALAVGIPFMVGGFFAYTYYFNVVVGDMSKYSLIAMSSVALVLVMFLVPVLSKKFSNIEIVMIFTVIGMLGYGLNYFAGSNIGLLFVAAIGTGTSLMPYSYLKSPLIMQIADYNTKIGLSRMEGTISSTVNFVGKVAQALGSLIIGILLTSSGYDGTLATQPQSAVNMIVYCYSIIPLVFMGLTIIVCLPFRKLDKLTAYDKK